MIIKDAAAQVITKYLRKGNMAMCLRDILPRSGLSLLERESVADIAHDFVRWKKLYDHILEESGFEKSPKTYVNLALEVNPNELHLKKLEIKYSCSSYVASLLKSNVEWANYLNEKPPTTLCVNFNKISIGDVIHILEQEKMPVKKSNLETAILTSSIGRYSSVVSKYYAHVQDESSQLVSYITTTLGDNILDFCAGNGGKSLAMASITRNEKKLYAHDINPKKLMIIEQRSKNYNAHISLEEKPGSRLFDVVLVDAPCTGIGAARRNPEAKYVESSGTFPQIQLEILKEAASKVKPGGNLLYSVCTFTPEETQEVLKNFLQENKFQFIDPKNLPYFNFLKKISKGAFILVPQGDIFFVSLLKKEK